MAADPRIHFIVSAPRSGSTWLTHALNIHPEIFATEHRLFGDFAEIWQNNDGSTAPRLTFDSYAKALSVHYSFEKLGLSRPQFVDSFQKAYAHFVIGFALRRTDANVVVDKITPYPGTADLVVDRIRSIFPASKIIQLVRDGRDVLTSGTFDWLLKDADGLARHRFFVENDRREPLTRFFDDDVIEKWTHNWRETIDVFEASPADTRISYEQMQLNQSSALQQVFPVIGVDTNVTIADTCAQASTFEKMTGRPPGTELPTAKARKGTVGDWKNYFTRRDAELFVELTGDGLIRLGYEPDSSWVEKCPLKLELRQV